jgi:hypothetical protein
MSVSLERQTEGTGEAKISNFKVLSTRVDEQVAGLEVTVHYTSFMAVE